MSTSEIAYVLGAFLTAMVICSLPMLGSLSGAGPRYRAIVIRSLVIGWAGIALMVAWLVVGWFATVEAGGRWFGLYRAVTLLLMGVSYPLIFIGIRDGNKSLAAARAADRGATA